MNKRLMRRSLGAALILLVGLPVSLRGDQHPGICRIQTRYDLLNNTTTVECDLVHSLNATGRLFIRANLSFPGRQPIENTKFWLEFSSCRNVVTRPTEPLFRNADVISLLTSSVQFEIRAKEYRSEFFEMNHQIAESVRAYIGSEDLQKLLDTTRLSGKWGTAEFRFSDDALDALKQLILSQVLARPAH